MFTQLLFLASLGKLYASPIDPTLPLSQDTDSFLYTRNPSTGTGDNLRTTYGIVWSCFVTILACVWSAVHPNIPGPYDAGWTILKRRMTMAFCALLAPELLAWWAMNQQSAAERIKEMYNREIVGQDAAVDQSDTRGIVFKWLASARKAVNERLSSKEESIREWFTKLPSKAAVRRKPRLMKSFKPVSDREPWTMAHGFFVQMGGFMLYEGEKPKKVLEFEAMCRMIKAGEIAAPTVTEAELKDRSKGNALSKCVIVLQTSWFVVQCLARRANGLPLTELEAVTLTFSFMNCIVYWVWWDKPQGVDIAIPIHLQFPDAHESTEAVAGHSAEGPTTSGLESLETGSVPVQIQLSGTDAQASASSTQSALTGSKNLRDTLGSFLGKIFAVMTCPLNQLSHMIMDDEILDGALTVPIFYYYGKVTSTYSAYITAFLIGLLFASGGIFTLAFVFRSPAEQSIWHVSVLTTGLGPALALLSVFIHAKKWLGNIFGKFLTLLFFVPAASYILGRIVILTVALLSLRALPKEVFVQISWTSFIPHF